MAGVMRRMESDAVGIVLEWDEEGEEVALAQRMLGPEGRDNAYDRLITLQNVMRYTEMEWVDVELMEKVRPVCGVRAAALVWRAEVRTEGGARNVARILAKAMGVDLDEEIR
jgi:hypothetical protein